MARRDREEKSERKEQSSKSHSKAEQFFTRNSRAFTAVLIIVLLAIPLFLGIAFRAGPYTLPAADEWARAGLEQSIRSQISAQVDKQYPTLPAASKQQYVEEQLATFVAQNKGQIDAQQKTLAQEYRSRLQGPDGHTYLPDLDPYHHLKRAEYYLQNGYPGSELRDGQPWDPQILAPTGVPVQMDLFAWVVGNGYRVASLFTETKPMYTLFWINLFFVSLSVIVIFLIGRHKGLFASFIAALLIAVHPGSITRTAAGVGDTEVLVLFLPLLAAWLLLEAFETKQGQWIRLTIFLGLSGLALGLLALVWEWWFFFVLFLLSLLTYLGYTVVRHALRHGLSRRTFTSKETVWAASLPVGFFVLTGIFVSICTNVAYFLGAFSSAFARTTGIKAATQGGTIYPNILTTVAELNQPSIATIVSNMGGGLTAMGKLLFIAAIMGLVFSLIPSGRLKLKDWLLLLFGMLTGLFLVSDKGLALSIVGFLAVLVIPVIAAGLLMLRDERDVDMKYAILLVVWLVASIYAMTKGLRFISLIIPPFAIAVALCFNAVFLLIKGFLDKNLGKSKIVAIPVLFIVLTLPIMPLAQQGKQVGIQSVPSMDDGWYDSLTKIKDDSDKNAIITSWWDFGHWFRYVADRGVTFDGASQRGELAHFIGRSLITNDEKETLAILRMVDCGSITSISRLTEAMPGKDDYDVVVLLKRIIMLPRADAEKELLGAGISKADAQEVLALTHCTPPEAFYITSADMIGKGGVWGHFGLWDFAKADAYIHFSQEPQATAVPAMSAKYGWSAAESARIYQEMRSLKAQDQVNSWISPWPSYLSQSFQGCYSPKNDSITCPMNVPLGQQQGFTTVIDGFVINETNRNSSAFSIGFYDQTGRRAGSTQVLPLSVTFVENGTFETFSYAGTPVGFSVLVRVDNGIPSAVLLTQEEHAQSVFTRLFFLEGEGTTAFEKFSDMRTFGGSRIIIWKVDWSKLDDLGLA